MFKPTSSIRDYAASGIGGAMAAILGLNLVGTMAIGAVANGIGYGVSKGLAALKVKSIESAPRATQKRYLRDVIYSGSQPNINVNYHTFRNATMGVKMELIETQLAGFRSGVYSTITSTSAMLIETE